MAPATNKNKRYTPPSNIARQPSSGRTAGLLGTNCHITVRRMVDGISLAYPNVTSCTHLDSPTPLTVEGLEAGLHHYEEASGLRQVVVFIGEHSEILGYIAVYPHGKSGPIETAKKPGEFLITVHPQAKRRGIALSLLAAVEGLWSLDLSAQRFTPAGHSLAEAFLAHKKSGTLPKVTVSLLGVEVGASIDDVLVQATRC